jgi:hypothetical protein
VLSTTGHKNNKHSRKKQEIDTNIDNENVKQQSNSIVVDCRDLNARLVTGNQEGEVRV